MVNSDQLLPEIKNAARGEIECSGRIGRQWQLIINVLNVRGGEWTPLTQWKLCSGGQNSTTWIGHRSDTDRLRENSLTKSCGRNRGTARWINNHSPNLFREEEERVMLYQGRTALAETGEH